MKQISETFIDVKVTLSFDSEKSFNQIMQEIVVTLENKDGNSLSLDYNCINLLSDESQRIHKFFDNVLGHVCDAAEEMSFEDYHGINGVVDYENNDIDELNEAHKEYCDFRQKILDVVGEDWITMINCYLALQGRVYS